MTARGSRHRVALALMVGLAGCARVVPMWDPPTTSFGRRPLSQVEEAIQRAALRRGWTTRKEEDGVMVATFRRRSHDVEVRIDYTESTFDLSHVRSSNLGYQRRGDGTEVIHTRYNGWVQRLELEMARELTKPRGQAPRG